jgi:hypothetical protein
LTDTIFSQLFALLDWEESSKMTSPSPAQTLVTVGTTNNFLDSDDFFSSNTSFVGHTTTTQQSNIFLEFEVVFFSLHQSYKPNN